MADADSKLEERVVRAAGAALAERRYVTAIDVLVGIGWLEPRRVEEWRQGRIASLEGAAEVGLAKISTAMGIFGRWARESARLQTIPTNRVDG